MLERTHDGNGVEHYAKVPDWLRTMLQTVGRYVHAQTKPLELRIAKLEAQIEELQVSGFKYAGVWQRAGSYSKGTVVTFDGSMFVAVKNAQPAQAPLTSDCWQLAVKAGRDAPRLPTKVVRVQSQCRGEHDNNR